MTRHHAELLARDVVATRCRLICEAVCEKVGAGIPGVIDEREDDAGRVWVVFVREGEELGEALAVYTNPQTSITGWQMVVEWHWAPVGNGRN